MSKSDTRNEIIRAMARAFFASAWADYEDNFGEGTGGAEVLDVMPEDIDPKAVKAAEWLASRMEEQEGVALPELLERAQANPYRYADRPCDAEHFGHYAAMQAMGHGVGLESVCDRSVFGRLPWLEFTYYNLSEDRFPIPA